MGLLEEINFGGLEFEGGEVGFVDFAEAEGVEDEACTSLDFDKVFSVLPVVDGEADGFFVVVDFKLFACKATNR